MTRDIFLLFVMYGGHTKITFQGCSTYNQLHHPLVVIIRLQARNIAMDSTTFH